MKKLIVTLTTALTLASTAAFAVVVPGWERPILQATMNVTQATGTLRSVRGPLQVTLTRQDTAQGNVGRYTGISILFPTQQNGKATRFRIVQSRGLNGAVTYIATQVFATGIVSESSMTVYLTSNSFQRPQPIWNLSIVFNTMGANTGNLTAVGIPQGVVTIQ